jgi:hypothetical protein
VKRRPRHIPDESYAPTERDIERARRDSDHERAEIYATTGLLYDGRGNLIRDDGNGKAHQADA